MKHSVRLMFAAIFAALLVTSVGTPSEARRATHHHFRRSSFAYDGVWSVALYTLRGNCPRSYRAAVRIAHSHVIAGDANYQVNGVVRPNGAIRVTVYAQGRYGYGYGRLRATRGGGRWRAAGGECSGSWTAVRRSR